MCVCGGWGGGGGQVVFHGNWLEGTSDGSLESEWIRRAARAAIAVPGLVSGYYAVDIVRAPSTPFPAFSPFVTTVVTHAPRVHHSKASRFP